MADLVQRPEEATPAPSILPQSALSSIGTSQPSAANGLPVLGPSTSLDDAAACPADFDAKAWETSLQKYGLTGLLCCREAMMPIAKPPEMAHLKFFICPKDEGELDNDPPEQREKQRENRKAKGKGKDKNSGRGGRFVQDMGKTEVLDGTQRGQWWKNTCTDCADVIVREQFSLTSSEVFKVPLGHYVQQAGPCEVFVNGQASGLQRMPVQPRGWATVDASSVGGPKYLEPISVPFWRVAFKSGSSKGDIVVRSGESLDSEEVTVLFCDARVEQAGPQAVLEDGIIRMPVNFTDSSSRDKKRIGWVTCDATAQGGPKFFEPWTEAEEQSATTVDQPSVQANAAAQAGSAGGTSNWDKNRLWKVVNLEPDDGRQLPVVKRVEPYAPGTGRVPSEDIVVRWLRNGDLLEQVGHSKKMRGYMVMPVRFVSAEGETDGNKEEQGSAEGWVTRRLVDKTRDHAEGSWLEEIREEGRIRRKSHRRDVED